MSEDPGIRLKRLRIRAWRRGTKEMDLILGRWSDRHLGALSGADLDRFEALLEESDQDLYRWITGQNDGPEALRPLLDRIAGEVAPSGQFPVH